MMLRKLIQDEGERYPELFGAWLEHGPGSLGGDRRAPRQLAHAGHLDVDDPDRAARQFIALVNAELQIPMLLGVAPSAAEIRSAVTNAVGTFLRAFGRDLATSPAGRGSSRGERVAGIRPDLPKRSRRAAASVS